MNLGGCGEGVEADLSLMWGMCQRSARVCACVLGQRKRLQINRTEKKKFQQKFLKEEMFQHSDRKQTN